MKSLRIGLESSSIMPLIAVTPISQDCYETIQNDFAGSIFLAHEDSITELKSIFQFKSNTFYSNPITRLEKIRELPCYSNISLKGIAIKLLLDGQSGGWIGNKNSRVQALFFSDVIDSISNEIDEPNSFCTEVTDRMRSKIQSFNTLLTPVNQILSISSQSILQYWGCHNISLKLSQELTNIQIKVVPNCESFDMFEHMPNVIRRDIYHYHMLKKESVSAILVGDANYKKNLCNCQRCMNYDCEVIVLKDIKRKRLLGLV